jgi:hypothetical protein
MFITPARLATDPVAAMSAAGIESGNSGSKQAKALADIHPAKDGSEATHFA